MSDLYKAIHAIETYVDEHPYADVMMRQGRKGNLWTVVIRDNGLLIVRGQDASPLVAIEQALMSIGKEGV